KLISYRVQFDSTENALACKILLVKLPFLGEYSLIDGINKNLVGRLILPIDNAICTIREPSCFISSLTNVYDHIDYTIRDSNGNVPSGFASLTLVFQTNSSFIS